MWLILTAVAAIVTTLLWYTKAPKDKYKLGFLSLIFWGATVMWVVDHLWAYLAGNGEFLEINLSATLLGVVVIIVGFILWGIFLWLTARKETEKRTMANR